VYNFWDLNGSDVENSDQTIQIIRRCSSVIVFKKILRKFSLIVDYTRQNHNCKRKEIYLDASFKIHSAWRNYNEQTCRLVLVDITVSDEHEKEIFKSYFHILVSFGGQIVDVVDIT
jgi:hypothetical protein